MKSLQELLTTRKSVRSFRSDAISPEHIREIVQAGMMAPTNCNQQLWNFIVLDDAEVKERLIKEAASNTLLRRCPVAIAVTYDGWNLKEAIQGASLAVGYMLLRAHDLGIGALPMNSYGGDRGVKRVLKIPDHEQICCFVLLGYPDDRALAQPLVPRRPIEEALHWNAWRASTRPPFTLNPELWTFETLAMHQKYYCRKTFLGKEMDIIASGERAVVREELAKKRGPFLDYLSYDGSLLREFPKGEVHTHDTAREVAEYTRVARGETQGESGVIFVDKMPQVETATLLFKAERISHEMFSRITQDAYAALAKGGEFVIIARTHNIFFTPFFSLVRMYFGKDTRRTGIFTYFGPYRLVRRRKLVRALEDAGFSVTWSGRQIFPAFFERVYQMVVQYIRSEGSSYLHREERDDFLSRFLARCIRFQKNTHFGRAGGILVIRARK